MTRWHETGLHSFFKTSQHKTGAHPFYIGMYIHIYIYIFMYIYILLRRNVYIFFHPLHEPLDTSGYVDLSWKVSPYFDDSWFIASCN